MCCYLLDMLLVCAFAEETLQSPLPYACRSSVVFFAGTGLRVSPHFDSWESLACWMLQLVDSSAATLPSKSDVALAEIFAQMPLDGLRWTGSILCLFVSSTNETAYYSALTVGCTLDFCRP